MRILFFISIVVNILLGCSSFYKESSLVSYDARLSGFKYPFEVQFFKFTSQNISLEMAYMDVAESKSIKSSNKTVVLFHGKNFSGYYWEQIAKDLSEKGFRVIIIDQIGFGKSSKPKHYSYSFSQFSVNTKSLLDHLGVESYSLVGHSMGGMLSVTFAYLFPEAVEKLILVNPIGLETYLDYVEFKDPSFFYKRELGKTPDGIISYQKKNYYDGQWNSSYEKLLEPALGQLNGHDWEAVSWVNALTYGPIFNEDVLSRLKKIKVNTYIVLGTRDRTGPGRGWMRSGVKKDLGRYDLFAKDLKKLSKKISVIELSGLGHMPHYEDYKRFSKIFYPLFSSSSAK